MRPEKQLLLDEISDYMDKSCAMIITRYEQLNPENSWALAEELSKCKSYFKVMKKRLLYKASEKKELPIKDQKIEGHVGVVFVQGDPLEASKVLVKFQGKNANSLKIVLGQIEGKLCSKEEIVTLSKLPGKDEMRAQLLGLVETPMAQTLSIMDNLLLSIVYCLKNKKKKV